MFDFTSRYYSVQTATWTSADGEVITYVRRRFLPPLDSQPILASLTTSQGDRLDLIAARTLGAGEQFWRISDANAVMNPLESTRKPGSVINIPMPSPTGK